MSSEFIFFRVTPALRKHFPYEKHSLRSPKIVAFRTGSTSARPQATPSSISFGKTVISLEIKRLDDLPRVFYFLLQYINRWSGTEVGLTHVGASYLPIIVGLATILLSNRHENGVSELAKPGKK